VERRRGGCDRGASRSPGRQRRDAHPGAAGLMSVEEGGAGGGGRLDLDARTGSIALPCHATKPLPFFDHDMPSTSFSTCSMKCLDVAAVLNSRHVPFCLPLRRARHHRPAVASRSAR
jgi:hypothetical protein